MKVILHSPLDMHLHLRDEDILKKVAKFSSECFAGAVIMPNLTPPVTSIRRVKAYKDRILEAIGDDKFEPFMTLFFKSDYDYDFLKEAKKAVKAIKLYPAGVTTNSKGGVEGFDTDKLKGTLEAMSELELPLSIHGETNGFVTDREREFLKIYEKLAKTFPKLKIVMEHITDKSSIKLLEDYENIFATVTLHHLYITLDDLLGGSLNPHLFCKPIVKTYQDRDALRELVLSGNDKVMFGSDSAPHLREKKECFEVAAGIFSAPVLLPKLCELFDEHGKLQNLQKFVSDNARKIYDIKPIKKDVVLEKEEMDILEEYNGIVPIFSKSKCSWRCKKEV